MSVVFAGIPVRRFQEACSWYERLLGRGPDLRPNDIEAAWKIEDSAWLYVIADADRAGKALLTVIIDNLDAFSADLAGRGLQPDEIEEEPGNYRKAVFHDPEGNTLGFGQVFTQRA